MSDLGRAELRRLLAEATPGPWVAEVSGKTGPIVMDAESVSALDHVARCPHYRGSADSELIVAAVNALPGLLDALGVAEATTERVRALHVRTDEWCAYHEDTLCGCFDAYCDECEVLWPCPTIQALDGGEPNE